jgi:hypothetical protein
MPLEKKEKIETYGRIKNHKPMVRVLLFMTAFIVILVALTVARGFILENTSEATQDNNQQTSTATKRSSNNNNALKFETIGYDISDLDKSEMIKDLPKSAVIELKLGENYYSIKKNSVSTGRPPNPDITISLPAEYISQISLGLCAMVKNANSNGDLSIKTHLSQTSLMWKYKGMLKYKSCLG